MTTETEVFVVTALVLLAATIYGVHATHTARPGCSCIPPAWWSGRRYQRCLAEQVGGHMRPDTEDPTRIEIAFEVKAGTPVNGQSKAQVGTVSLMGTPSLLITTGSNEAPRLAPGAVVPSQESVSTSELARRVGTVVDNANNVLLDLHREIPEIAAQLHSVLDNVNTLTGRENQQQIRTVLAGVRTLVNDSDAVIVSAKPLMAASTRR